MITLGLARILIWIGAKRGNSALGVPWEISRWGTVTLFGTGGNFKSMPELLSTKKRGPCEFSQCIGCKNFFSSFFPSQQYCLKSCRTKTQKRRNRNRIKEFRCTVCNKIFDGRAGTTIKQFCSLECRRIKHPPKPPKLKVHTCARCNKEFSSLHSSQKYCSLECRSCPKPERTCHRCSKTFVGSNWKYCSKACATGQQSIIYFILGTHTRRLKVGLSTQFHKRLDGLRRSNWDDLEVLGTIPGDFEEEQAIHKELESHRTHYEFYDYAPEVKSVVDRYLKV